MFPSKETQIPTVKSITFECIVYQYTVMLTNE